MGSADDEGTATCGALAESEATRPDLVPARAWHMASPEIGGFDPDSPLMRAAAAKGHTLFQLAPIGFTPTHELALLGDGAALKARLADEGQRALTLQQSAQRSAGGLTAEDVARAVGSQELAALLCPAGSHQLGECRSGSTTRLSARCSSPYTRANILG